MIYVLLLFLYFYFYYIKLEVNINSFIWSLLDNPDLLDDIYNVISLLSLYYYYIYFYYLSYSFNYYLLLLLPILLFIFLILFLSSYYYFSLYFVTLFTITNPGIYFLGGWYTYFFATLPIDPIIDLLNFY